MRRWSVTEHPCWTGTEWIFKPIAEIEKGYEGVVVKNTDVTHLKELKELAIRAVQEANVKLVEIERKIAQAAKTDYEHLRVVTAVAGDTVLGPDLLNQCPTGKLTDEAVQEASSESLETGHRSSFDVLGTWFDYSTEGRPTCHVELLFTDEEDCSEYVFIVTLDAFEMYFEKI